MTRVEKNSVKYSKRKKKVKIKVFKSLFKSIIYLLVGIIYLIYLLLKFINKIVAKAFMKMPKLIRVAIIYLLIASSIYGNLNVKTVIKEVVKEEELVIKFDKPEIEATETNIIIEETKQEETQCRFNEIECRIYEKAINEGLSENQAYLIMAISKHETGNWTSRAFNEKNNFGGIMCSTGLKRYENFDEGLEAFVNLLKNRYFNKGLNTIEQIGNVYCPIGASNDPRGVNQYWIPNVSEYYNNYLK